MNKISSEALRRWWLTPLIALAALLGAGLVWASPADDAAQRVKVSTAELVEKLNQERQTFYRDPEAFYGIMESALSSVVDFERIAARVMGKYRRGASDAQKTEFTEVFKRSMFRAYGKTLVETGEFKVTVLGGEDNARDSTRANVNLEVVSASGNKYPVVYAMYLNAERGWLLENVIVNGVNVGLAFRDKFEQQYTQYQGNIDAVVANWSATAVEVQIQAEGGAG